MASGTLSLAHCENTCSTSTMTTPISCGEMDDKILLRDASRLAALLMELKQGLDEVRSKVEPLFQKVKEGMYMTKDGISYLDTKYLLLLGYCQCLVYYLLRKANGFSIQDHPVVSRLVEMRLFLEKIRPIDKKLQYQIDKLSRAPNTTVANGVHGKTEDITGDDKGDALKYKPNPDMLISKLDESVEQEGGVYKPPKFAPTMMEESDDRLKKQEKRMQKETLYKGLRSAYVRDLANELEGKPEEVREVIGAESKELVREQVKLQKRARQEEELFTRVPLSKQEKKKLKHLKKSRNGLMGLMDDFDDDVSGLMAIEHNEFTGSRAKGSHASRTGKRKFKKHKGKR